MGENRKGGVKRWTHFLPRQPLGPSENGWLASRTSAANSGSRGTVISSPSGVVFVVVSQRSGAKRLGSRKFAGSRTTVQAEV